MRPNGGFPRPFWTRPPHFFASARFFFERTFFCDFPLWPAVLALRSNLRSAFIGEQGVSQNKLGESAIPVDLGIAEHASIERRSVWLQVH